LSALLTDLYELTMAAGYFAAGKTSEKATFELSIRSLPPNRDFILIAGLPQVVEYLERLHFEPEEIDYLRRLPQFERAPAGFFDYLKHLRFTGDLFAVPEGTPMFAGEPVLSIRAPIIEAQLPETYVLAALTFQSLIATKAARLVEAAGGRGVVEFGSRRAHTPEAGVLGARAAYIGGCTGTSNTLAGYRFGIPVRGTAAHSWVMSFASETEAFRRMQQVLGPHTVHLVDTYDSLEGTRRAASLGEPLWGIRLDSGNFLELSRAARRILDGAGLKNAKIMASGDLDEAKLRALGAANAPIDSYGVGTQLATSADAPALGAVYKLVELEIGGIKRFTAKYSEDKATLPGAKQVFRTRETDLLARSGECGRGEALLRPVMLGGKRIEPLPDLAAARERVVESLKGLDLSSPRRIERSQELEALIAQTAAQPR
jgi:nicotinate phosphoribosyltransferase